MDDTIFQSLQDRDQVRDDFRNFLEGEDGNGPYSAAIDEMIENNRTRLNIRMTDLRRVESYRNGFVRNPINFMPGFHEALQEIVYNRSPDYAKKERIVSLGFEGSFGRSHVSPRTLLSSHVSTMVSVDGIVTKCSSIRPKIIKSVHYCEATKQTSSRTYNDSASLVQDIPTPAVYPTEDADGNKLTTEFGKCLYRDQQTITIQEMPEKSPAGQLPRAVDVLLDGDLCGTVKPGDRINAVGVYRALPRKSNGKTNGIFKTIVIANNVKQLSKEVDSPITMKDIDNIKKVAQRQDVFEAIAKSLAPSIYGSDMIKQALLLLLLGGCEKNLDDGTHLRGDINMLMIGDPSTAKSQLLRFAHNIAPLAINTTGRGSSGVGLTAAVTTDPDSGERRLEAGAMVLGDRGLVCIDEFDKMSDIDRVAIHEVMEQQTVTICKAGIHASLNARCSVLAAANPVYGQYNSQEPPEKNIGLSDSLISRFDLLFVVLDRMDSEEDQHIANHVLAMHRHKVAAGVNPEDSDDDEEEQETAVYTKLLTGGNRRSRSKELLTVPFLKKFIQFAKYRATKNPPTLTTEAEESIHGTYCELRQDRNTKTTCITARTLETLIRLATAHAKCRLSNQIEQQDAEVAARVLRYALSNAASVEEGDVIDSAGARKLGSGKGGSKKRRAAIDDDGDDDEDDAFAFKDEIVDTPGKKKRKSASARAVAAEAAAAAEAGDEEEEGQDAAMDSTATDEVADEQAAGDNDMDIEDFMERVSQWLRRRDNEGPIGQLAEHLEMGVDQCQALLAKLEEENRVMVIDDKVVLI